jgi:hypothetical protein
LDWTVRLDGEATFQNHALFREELSWTRGAVQARRSLLTRQQPTRPSARRDVQTLGPDHPHDCINETVIVNE